jgi:hypothetical protein
MGWRTLLSASDLTLQLSYPPARFLKRSDFLLRFHFHFDCCRILCHILREYVWKKSKAPKLIDSLYRGFPISSLLL